MTDLSKISELIERSSLGTTGARSLRERTPPAAARTILDRAAEHERTTACVTANLRSDADLLLRARDGDLLLWARDGDLAAWEEIVGRYGGRVSATVRSLGLQDADALDAIQMTWLRLMTNLHRVQDPERLGGWLITTARRECLSVIRESKRTAHRDAVTCDTVADPSVDPEQYVLAAETVLPLRGRTLLRALFSDSPRPYAEIARATGIPVGSMGPTRARALLQLQRMLDERGLGPGVSL